MTDKLDEYYESNDFYSKKPVYIDTEELTDTQLYRLTKSDTFCMLPWIHMHAFPDGRAYPCCLSLMQHPIGSLREQTMQEVWNDEPLRQMRVNMLNEKPCKECTKCYEQEANGFFSMRNSQNKNMGHHIGLVDETHSDGTLERFELKYYDIRFSNLCNLSCRTCGDIFSSNWVKESKKMGWLPKDAPNVSYAGRYEMDMWEQMEPHLDTVENIYFAGGEPLMMVEHFNILQELVQRGRTDVRLNYNTNFTETIFKQQDILELWNKFDRVSVGASLDANYERGELMRKGTNWDKVVANRMRMMEVCPDVDFFISCTLSIMNVFNVVDFHREWVDQGLINPQDFHINILQDPQRYRIDALPKPMKQRVEELYNTHIEWLEPQDHLARAVNGFRSAVTFMNATDNSELLKEFVYRTDELDKFRNENFFAVFPELEELRQYA